MNKVIALIRKRNARRLKLESKGMSEKDIAFILIKEGLDLRCLHNRGYRGFCFKCKVKRLILACVVEDVFIAKSNVYRRRVKGFCKKCGCHISCLVKNKALVQNKSEEKSSRSNNINMLNKRGHK